MDSGPDYRLAAGARHLQALNFGDTISCGVNSGIIDVNFH
jgi:hypothetical protein